MEKLSVNFEDKKTESLPSLFDLYFSGSFNLAFGYFSKDYTVKLDYKVYALNCLCKKEFSLSDSVVTIALNQGCQFLNSKYSENRYVNSRFIF